MENVFRNYYLAKASLYKKSYPHLNCQMNSGQAKERLEEWGISEEFYNDKLIDSYSPHLLKALCCIALGENSKKILQDRFLNESCIEILMEEAHHQDGWNTATIMVLMRLLFE